MEFVMSKTKALRQPVQQFLLTGARVDRSWVHEAFLFKPLCPFIPTKKVWTDSIRLLNQEMKRLYLQSFDSQRFASFLSVSTWFWFFFGWTSPWKRYLTSEEPYHQWTSRTVASVCPAGSRSTYASDPQVDSQLKIHCLFHWEKHKVM